MLGFHKHLKEIEGLVEAELGKPAEEQKWDEVFSNLKEHKAVDLEIRNDVKKAAKFLADYERKLVEVWGYVEHGIDYDGLKGWNKTFLKKNITGAVEDAKFFEEVVFRIMKKGKGLE